MTEGSRSRALSAAAIVLFLAGLLVITWNIPLPLIAYSPGPVTDAVDAVEIDGAEVYPVDGELVMLTVAGQDINAFEALVAAVDPSVDVLARQAVRRADESDEDYRRRNLQLMDQSTATAIGVALEHLQLEGEAPSVFITGYAADTPAGAVLQIGDQIVSLAGEEIASTEDLAETMAGTAPGDSVTIEIRRDREILSYDIELVAQEEDPERAMIGVFVRQLPFWIGIDSGIVGGPSAGLMYSLAVIDVLTPEGLTGGQVVAGTGTIDPEGNVGNIGGVRQKVVAAEAAGADYMLVPQGNYEAARTAPRGDMELVPVATIEEALEFLATLG